MPSESAPPGPAAVSARPPDLTKGLSILYLEADAQLRRAMVRQLKDEFLVVGAATPAQALQLLTRSERQFAVMVTDGPVQGLGGPALAQYLAEHRSDLVQVRRNIAPATVHSVMEDVPGLPQLQAQTLPVVHTELQLRIALRAALARFHRSWSDQTRGHSRTQTLRDTLSFVAWELSIPQARVVGWVSSVIDRLRVAAERQSQGVSSGLDQGIDQDLIEPLARALDAVLASHAVLRDLCKTETRADNPIAEGASAAGIVTEFLAGYPFEGDCRGWVQFDACGDFRIRAGGSLVPMVLGKLVGNSLRFLDGQPGPSIRIEVLPGDGAESRHRICVSDNGPGISPAIRAELAQETWVGVPRHMGMRVCRQIMLSLGGDMVVESADATGTRITLLFDTPAARR